MPGLDTSSAGSSNDQHTTATANAAVTEPNLPLSAKNGSPPLPSPAAPPANPTPANNSKMAVDERPELDDFGLPVRKYTWVERAKENGKKKAKAGAHANAPSPASRKTSMSTSTSTSASKSSPEAPAATDIQTTTAKNGPASAAVVVAVDQAAHMSPKDKSQTPESGSDEDFKDAVSATQSDVDMDGPRTPMPPKISTTTNAEVAKPLDTPRMESQDERQLSGAVQVVEAELQTKDAPEAPDKLPAAENAGEEQQNKVEDQAVSESKKDYQPAHNRERSDASAVAGLGISEFSHQQLTSHKPDTSQTADDDWQTMPAYAPYDIYDDDNKLIAKEYDETEIKDETYGYAGLGGAGKGYTRVLLDDDAESATSMDENTQYLFKDQGPTTSMTDEEETQRDAVSQLQATKDLLTEGQRIAYVGLTRLELSAMLTEAEKMEPTTKTKKQIAVAAENMKMWSQKMMIRLYTHMDISPAEQIMIEQLSAHGVMPADLTPLLMANARVKNPMAEEEGKKSSDSGEKSPRPASAVSPEAEEPAEPPPAYTANDDTELTAPVRTPSEMPTTQKIDIDLRWTVLCDLFLVLIADSIYDSRSRVLLERVGQDLEIPWIDICRFEKKVTDALEMQQNAEKENWNEDEHMENRRKLALKRRYVMMGLATVGGGLVIGLSAGLLAPMIAGGLVAGFTTIGVTGTGSFLAGAGSAAIITSGAAASGSIIGGKAASRRTGAVKTFEYRPLHNNKRVNLIVTVAGWMTGKVDDVRLPFSTVDPVMGDIYSVLWEPEMLTSMGDTINILATEALTQGLQQILASTILMSLMAALQLPIVLTKLAYLIDNPWTVSLDRATMAGLILADSLIDRNLGTRPITLVGYSLGSRVIFSCLQELAKKGAYGLVQNVFLFGSPMVVKHDEYMRARTVVAGRFVNGYNRNDWILGYLFRLTGGGIRRVAGLAPIENIPGLENMDVSEFVVGHMDYRTAMPRLLRECGWSVESDEFSEIEDPDPENHGERQRELINEIEEARKEFEKEGKASKGSFSFWRKKKALQKQEWEVYEDSIKTGKGKTEDKEGNNHGVLFDVDAIRAELAREQQQHGKDGELDEELLQVREIKSTLPPMKLDLSPGPPPPPPVIALRSSLRETRSAEAVPQRSSNELTASHLEYRPSPQHSRQTSSEIRRVGSERTPTFPSSKAENDYYGQFTSHSGFGSSSNGLADEDDEVQMTFDTAFDDNIKPDYTSAFSPIASHSRHTSVAAAVDSPTRPEIKSAKTVPNIIHNPWGADDDDDEEFGKEKEIEMTFA